MVVEMAAKIPDSKFPSDRPFTIFSKTPVILKEEESHFPLGNFGWKFWTTFQDVPSF